MTTGFRLGRDAGDIGGDGLGERGALAVVEQLDAMHEEVFVLAERDRWAPAFPACRAAAAVELRAEEAEDDEMLGRHSLLANILAYRMVFRSEERRVGQEYSYRRSQ